MTPTDREQQARALADKLNRMESLEYDGYDELLDAQQVMVVALLADTERATLERVILVQCSKCNARDQYSEAVMEVGQWMHQHILSQTWTLCDAERIHKYKKAQGVLQP